MENVVACRIRMAVLECRWIGEGLHCNVEKVVTCQSCTC